MMKSMTPKKLKKASDLKQV
jgi:hypothetical protein